MVYFEGPVGTDPIVRSGSIAAQKSRKVQFVGEAAKPRAIEAEHDCAHGGVYSQAPSRGRPGQFPRKRKHRSRTDVEPVENRSRLFNWHYHYVTAADTRIVGPMSAEADRELGLIGRERKPPDWLR